MDRHPSSLLVALCLSLLLHVIALAWYKPLSDAHDGEGRELLLRADFRRLSSSQDAAEVEQPKAAKANQPEQEASVIRTPDPVREKPLAREALSASSSGSGVPISDHYYLLSELDVAPVVTKDIERPIVRDGPRREGVAVFWLWLSESGRVEKVDIVQSEWGVDMTQFVAGKIYGMEFSPGRRGGSNVRVRMRIAMDMGGEGEIPPDLQKHQ